MSGPMPDPTRSHAHPVWPPPAPSHWNQPYPTPAQQPAPRRPRTGLWLLLGGAAAVIAAAITLTLVLLPGTFTATGSLVLVGSTSEYSSIYDSEEISYGANGSCHGVGGYSDLAVGTGVTIHGASGQLLSIGSIVSSAGDSGTDICAFQFEVREIPAGEGPYTVEVSHRGEVAVTEDDLAGGKTELSIGD